MNILELEKGLDDFLATPDDPINGAIDRNWTNAAEQLEKKLAENSDSIDIETMIRVLSKSISAFNKLLIDNAIRNDLNVEQIVKHRIDDYHYWQVIYEALPQSIRSENGRNAAKSRHATTYELRDKIIAYWRENITPDKSNEFAAEILQNIFPNVAHRTLANYVAAAKKLPPAGTA